MAHMRQGSVVLLILTASAFAEKPEFQITRSQSDGDIAAEAAKRSGVRVVRTSHDRISDASFAAFSRWPELRGVYLWNTTATGSGFHRLKKQKKLVQVSLMGPNVNDHGVEAVSKLPYITHLHIGNVYDTTDCKYRLHRPVLTDRALISVAGMPKLAYLSIDNAGISDEGIQRLAALKSIRSIQFFRCSRLTKEGLDRLKAALPKVHISAHVSDR